MFNLVFFIDNYTSADPTQMVVSWVTQKATQDSWVEYGINNLGSKAKGQVTKFYNSDTPSGHVSYIHTATMTGLVPGQRYRKLHHAMLM